MRCVVSNGCRVLLEELLQGKFVRIETLFGWTALRAAVSDLVQEANWIPIRHIEQVQISSTPPVHFLSTIKFKKMFLLAEHMLCG